jgi:nitroreductase
VNDGGGCGYVALAALATPSTSFTAVASVNVLDAIAQRRSIRNFLDRPLAREELEPLLDAAALGPNHRLTQPWRFYVLGPEARHAYGLALGVRKAKKIEDPEAARVLRERTGEEHRAWPAMIAVAMVLNENPEIREEDYAAVMMGIENLALAAVARGLGTHIRTGGVMQDPAARTAVGVGEGERVVAIIAVGVPAEIPPPKPRQPAEAVTVWRE